MAHGLTGEACPGAKVLSEQAIKRLLSLKRKEVENSARGRPLVSSWVEEHAVVGARRMIANDATPLPSQATASLSMMQEREREACQRLDDQRWIRF
jgi:hypothetical protein